MLEGNTPTRIVELPHLTAAGEFETKADYPLHAHDATELVLCVDGHHHVDVDGLSIEGRPGDLMILPARVPHNIRPSGGLTRVVWLLVEGGEHLLDMSARTIAVGGDPILTGWMKNLCEMRRRRWRGADPATRDALLLAVLSYLAESESREQSSDPLHPRLKAALAFLQDNWNRTVAAAELARAAGVSYSHLSALFRARFDCGPLHYHQALRMDHARQLLQDPYLRVSDVAAQAGFENANYFSRLFASLYGVSPNEWRNGHRRHDGNAAPSVPNLSFKTSSGA